jgi:predicted deacylase
VTDDLLPFARLPLTYDECRARLHRAAATAGCAVTQHPIDALGPAGQQLTIDVTQLGPDDADTLLVVMSGVHGVEGFIGSALQCDLLARVGGSDLPPGVGVLLVHAVNPWGMAWGRRQNESNVDLNRNWRRSDIEPVHNDAYDELHHLACPSTSTMPSVEDLLVAATAMVDERGLDWVRDAITTGQYRHGDGLHFGGDRTEDSSRIVEQIAHERVVGRARVLVLDLHTGHGPRGEVVLLSDQAPDSAQHAFLTRRFPSAAIEATIGNAEATTGPKTGQLANGIRSLLPEGTCWSTSVEFGTASDLEQLAATYLAHWVHFHGDPADPSHREALWQYRSCFTPDDPVWERTAFARGRVVLEEGLAAVTTIDAPTTTGG